MPSTYTPIATYTVSSAQTSYTFTSIPSTYTDLILVGSAATNTNVDIWLRFNGDSASTNYSRTFVYGDGSSALSGRTSNASNIGAAYGSTSSSTFVIQLMNYSNTNLVKLLIVHINKLEIKYMELKAMVTKHFKAQYGLDHQH